MEDERFWSLFSFPGHVTRPWILKWPSDRHLGLQGKESRPRGDLHNTPGPGCGRGSQVEVLLLRQRGSQDAETGKGQSPKSQLPELRARAQFRSRRSNRHGARTSRISVGPCSHDCPPCHGASHAGTGAATLQVPITARLRGVINCGASSLTL